MVTSPQSVGFFLFVWNFSASLESEALLPAVFGVFTAVLLKIHMLWGVMLSRLVDNNGRTEGMWCLYFQSPTSGSSNSWIGDRDDGATRIFEMVVTVYQS